MLKEKIPRIQKGNLVMLADHNSVLDKNLDQHPAVDVEAGKTYFWCTCGQSAKQPFCDGSHQVEKAFAPMKWTAEQDGKKFFCTCKQTGNSPLCDGSHKQA